MIIVQLECLGCGNQWEESFHASDQIIPRMCNQCGCPPSVEGTDIPSVPRGPTEDGVWE